MLSLVEIILLGIALGMDCFSVSLAVGVMKKQFVAKTMITLALLFGLFQAMMPFLGWIGTVYFGQYISKVDYIAFFLLAYIGIKSIIDGLKNKEEPSFDPTKFAVMITLSIATSIDALAVGISFTCMGMTEIKGVALAVLIIGIASTVMSFIGNWIGIALGKRFHFPAEVIGGIILILIGLKILYEHFF